MSEEQWVYGMHAVNALLSQHAKRVSELLVVETRGDERLQRLIELANEQRVTLRKVSKKEIDELCSERHQGVIARCRPLETRGGAELPDFLESLDVPPLLLFLDGVTDPHNFGACLRSAEAAGVHAVIIPKDKSADLGPVARKVACGAAEIVPVFKVTNLSRAMKELQDLGVWFVGLAGEADKSIYETDFKGAMAIVMGAEGYGLRQQTRTNCDYLANIPMQGVVSSLNVSVATGITVFEALRQRNA